MPVPAQSRDQFGGIFDPILGSSGDIRPSEQLLGGFDRSAYNPTWSIPTNIAYPLPHRPQDPYLGATSSRFLIPGFNPSIPSHTPAQPYQWNTHNQFPPIDLSLNNFDTHSLFHTTEYPSSGTIVDNLPQGLFSGATGNSQSTVPPVVTSAVNAPFSGKLSGSYHSREPLGESTGSGPPYSAPSIIPPQEYYPLCFPTYAVPSQETMSSQTEIQERVPASSSQLPRTIVPISTSSGCGQAQAIPMRDSQSIPSPASIITNTSTLCHAALRTPRGSLPPENILQRASRPDPVIPYPIVGFDGLVSGGSMSQACTPSELHRRMPNSLVHGELTKDNLTTKSETGRSGRDAGRDKNIQAGKIVSPPWEFSIFRSRPMVQSARTPPWLPPPRPANERCVISGLDHSKSPLTSWESEVDIQQLKSPVRLMCLLTF